MKDIESLSLEEISELYNKKLREKQAVAEQERVKKEQEAERIAAIGREEASKRCSDIVETIDKLFDELESLTIKHRLYYSISFAGGSLNFSRWGRDAEGWESSSC